MNDLNDWEDDLLENDNPQIEERQFEEPQEEDSYEYQEEESSDVLDQFLRSKGINPDSIKFET